MEEEKEFLLEPKTLSLSSTVSLIGVYLLLDLHFSPLSVSKHSDNRLIFFIFGINMEIRTELRVGAIQQMEAYVMSPISLTYKNFSFVFKIDE